MAELYASGRVVDLIALIVFAEFAVLAFLRWRTGRGLPPAALAATLAAGLFLLMALRAALQGRDWTVIAAWLLAAMAAHVVDLWLRWPRGPRPG